MNSVVVASLTEMSPSFATIDVMTRLRESRRLARTNSYVEERTLRTPSVCHTRKVDVASM